MLISLFTFILPHGKCYIRYSLPLDVTLASASQTKILIGRISGLPPCPQQGVSCTVYGLCKTQGKWLLNTQLVQMNKIIMCTG